MRWVRCGNWALPSLTLARAVGGRSGCRVPGGWATEGWTCIRAPRSAHWNAAGTEHPVRTPCSALPQPTKPPAWEAARATSTAPAATQRNPSNLCAVGIVTNLTIPTRHATPHHQTHPSLPPSLPPSLSCCRKTAPLHPYAHLPTCGRERAVRCHAAPPRPLCRHEVLLQPPHQLLLALQLGPQLGSARSS